MANKFDVLSPDGISIHREIVYDSIEEAQAALKEWMQRYEVQGYYSTAEGRIWLDELESCCRIIQV